jgi:SAM-dependent methyltransferase
MSFLEYVHGSFVARRRANVLAEHFANLLPMDGVVLDIGCGDGYLASLIQKIRSDVTIVGVDVLLRKRCWIPVEEYDGLHLPYADGAFDAVLLVDVIHHLTEPMTLLREASRVAGRSVIIKDHRCDALLAAPTLRFMDQIGNRRFGVVLTYDYWCIARWQQVFRELGWELEYWTDGLGLYPFPINLVFERSLHFIAKLTVNTSTTAEPHRDADVPAAREQGLAVANITAR